MVTLCSLPSDLTITNDAFRIYGVSVILSVNSINQLIFVMVMGRVFFAVRVEFLNII
jgi:hypothetical protein